MTRIWVAIFSFYLCVATAQAVTPYEKAVAYEVERDLEKLLAGYLRGHRLPLDELRIQVIPDLDTTTHEPWLRSLDVQVVVPGTDQDRQSVQRLLRAHFVSRGFGRTHGDRPSYSLSIAAPVQAATGYHWWQGSMLAAFGLLLLGFGVLMFQIRPWRRTSQQMRCWVKDSKWDPGSLGLASAEQLRNLFRKVPIAEAMRLLSSLDEEDRRRVLDALRMQTAVRQRVERRLQRIRAHW